MSPLTGEMTKQILSAPASVIRSMRYSETARGRSTSPSKRLPTGRSSFENARGWIRLPTPGDARRILGAGDDEPARPQPTRRLDEQRVERRLSIGRIGPEIGQVGGEARIGIGAPVHRWIHRPVERRDHGGAEALTQLVE